VFQKSKNLKTKLQERAVSYEEQMGLLPEPLGSPEILSGGRLAFPDYQYSGPIKQEIINLDDYQIHHQYANNPNLGIMHMNPCKAELNNTSSHSMLSSSNLVRALSFRRPVEDYLNIPESPSFQGEFQHEATTSGSDGGDGDESIVGWENVDWSALLQEPPKPISGTNEFPRCPSGKMIGTDLVQIKRQNSDIFSSLDLWNYSQVAQQQM